MGKIRLQSKDDYNDYIIDLDMIGYISLRRNWLEMPELGFSFSSAEEAKGAYTDILAIVAAENIEKRSLMEIPQRFDYVLRHG